MNNVYEVRKPDLVPYHRRDQSLAHAFTYFNIEHVPRGKNARADADAWLAASPSDGHKYHTVLERRILPPLDTYEALAECNRRSVRITIDEVGIRRFPISFIQYGILPNDPNEKVSIRRRVPPLRSSNENIVSEILRWSAPAVSVGPRCREGHSRDP